MNLILWKRILSQSSCVPELNFLTSQFTIAWEDWKMSLKDSYGWWPPCATFLSLAVAKSLTLTFLFPTNGDKLKRCFNPSVKNVQCTHKIKHTPWTQLEVIVGLHKSDKTPVLNRSHVNTDAILNMNAMMGKDSASVHPCFTVWAFNNHSFEIRAFYYRCFIVFSCISLTLVYLFTVGNFTIFSLQVLKFRNFSSLLIWHSFSFVSLLHHQL